MVHRSTFLGANGGRHTLLSITPTPWLVPDSSLRLLTPTLSRGPGCRSPSQPFPPSKLIPHLELPPDLQRLLLVSRTDLFSHWLFSSDNPPSQGGPKASQTGLVKFSPSPSCILSSSLFSHVITIHTCYSLRVSSFSTRPHRSHWLNPLNGSEICSVFSSCICYHFLATLMLPRPPTQVFFPKCGTSPTGGRPIWC